MHRDELCFLHQLPAGFYVSDSYACIFFRSISILKRDPLCQSAEIKEALVLSISNTPTKVCYFSQLVVTQSVRSSFSEKQM